MFGLLFLGVFGSSLFAFLCYVGCFCQWMLFVIFRSLQNSFYSATWSYEQCSGFSFIQLFDSSLYLFIYLIGSGVVVCFLAASFSAFLWC